MGPANAGTGERTAELVREGDYWTVAFNGRELRVRDSKGMGYLAELLARPGTEVPALELAGGRSPEPISAGSGSQGGLTLADESDLGPMLDADAKTAYRRRLEELRTERDEADAFNDPERAARARAEYDLVARELASAIGIGGRDRRAGSPAERARLNVTRAIKTSIERLSEDDHKLGEFLTKTVLTGRVCVYRPERAEPVHWRVITRAPRAATRRRFEPPDTHYVQAHGVNIAYQVLGDGPVDVVFRPGWLSHLDFQWTDPTFTRLLRNLAGFSRLIMFDKGGVGLSDPVVGVPPLEERMGELSAVLNAVGSERSVLFGLYEAGATFGLYAATYPELTQALVLYGAVPGGFGATGFPGSAQLAEVGQGLRAAVDSWGRGATLAVLAPDLAHNRLMRRLWGTFERASMSPAVARAQLDWIDQVDIRAALPAIRVPTLVVHCTGDVVPIAAGRYVAECIPGARFCEIPGDWHAPLTGDMDLLTDTIREFVSGVPPEKPPDRVLTTVLVLEPIEEGATVGGGRARERVAARGGVVIDDGDECLMARFDGPARAIRCALVLLDDARARGEEARAGIHTGECELSPGGVVGVPASIAAELAAAAIPGEALTTGTVRDLVVGSGIEFSPRGVCQIADAPGDWPTFAATGTADSPDMPAAVTARIPLFDRAARRVARDAPAMSRATLRLVKGDK